MKLKRYSNEPLLIPDPQNAWEALNVFNCAVVHHNNLFHMVYRAQGVDYVSRLGYAVSADGLRWNRLSQPIMSPDSTDEARGIEDPRIVRIDDVWYMTYTGYSRNGIVAKFARSSNMITWERLTPFEPDNKDHVLFSTKIGERFCMLHRRTPNIWLAYSDDLRTWEDHKIVMAPRDGVAWEAEKIGASGPPILTDDGWLLIYHGVDAENVYRQGVALLDREDPTRVLYRPKSFILEPDEPWEQKGDVPNVVFSCANPVVFGLVYVYYAGADRCIGLATATLREMLDFVKNDSSE